jgi:hypothetical protein
MFEVNIPVQERGTSQVLFNHTPASVPHSFDDENLTATTGLVPIMGLAQKAGLPELADDRLTVATRNGSMVSDAICRRSRCANSSPCSEETSVPIRSGW